MEIITTRNYVIFHMHDDKIATSLSTIRFSVDERADVEARTDELNKSGKVYEYTLNADSDKPIELLVKRVIFVPELTSLKSIEELQ